MRPSIPILAALAVLLTPVTAPAQDTDYVRPLDRIYGPKNPSDGAPAAGQPAIRKPRTGQGAEPAMGSPGGRAGGEGAGGGASAGRSKGGSDLGTASKGGGTGTVRKPAGPTHRGGMVGTRPRMSRSPSLSAPRR